MTLEAAKNHFRRELFKFLLLGFFVASLVSCNFYDLREPLIPDSIKVEDKPEIITGVDCLVYVYNLEKSFSETLLKNGFQSALKSVGSRTPIIPSPTYRGDFPPRELEYGEYWYRSPLEDGTFRSTSSRSYLVGQLSECLDKDIRFKNIRLFASDYRDAFVSFRNDADFLYVILPNEKVLLVAKLLR